MSRQHSNDYRKRIFVGVSKDDSTGPPSFRQCAEDVHAQMEKLGMKGRLRILESTHNPLTEYSVVFVVDN
jgi:7-cyano-7-deazaguanine synthase in queuosine biosynthesis